MVLRDDTLTVNQLLKNGWRTQLVKVNDKRTADTAEKLNLVAAPKLNSNKVRKNKNCHSTRFTVDTGIVWPLLRHCDLK